MKAARSGSITRRGFARGTVAAAGLLASPALLRWGARAAEPLKIGVILPRSGFLALIGQACQRGCDIAVPLLAERGMPVQLMNADTESSPDVARTQAEKLIRDGAHIIVGAFESGATAAIAQVAEQKGVPTSPMLVTNGLKRMKNFFEATGKTPKTAVFMHVNDTFGQSMLAGITALAPQIGLPFQILETISYDPKARDLSIEVAKAKATGAELNFVVTRLNDAILMVREMVKQKFEPMGIVSPGSPGMYESQFLKTLGKYADYCVSNVPWMNPKQELSGILEAAFKKAYPDQDYDLNIGFSFEGIQICADAAQRAGSTAPQALVEALKATNIENRVMIGGPIHFDAKGQNPDQVSAAVQNRDGKPVVTLPEEAATTAPVFPMPGWAQRG